MAISRMPTIPSPEPYVNGFDDVDRPSVMKKASSPLMPSFMVSAPGKVIVYGEHAVVYGKAAIAASISLRSYLLVSFHSKVKRTVSLVFADVDLDFTWNIDDLPWDAFAAPGKKKLYRDVVTELDEDLVAALQPHLDIISPHQPEYLRKIHQASAKSFLYLFLSLGSKKSYACVYTLRSTIPIGAGLGSSASIAVCLAAALLKQVEALHGPVDGQLSQEAQVQLDRINHWAFVAEMCIHDNPSGVDNTVSTNGKAVRYQRQNYTQPPKVEFLGDFPELPLLLVNTRQSRSTKLQLEKVANLRRNHPEIAEHILDAIHNTTEKGHTLINSKNFNPDAPEARRMIGELISVNHGLLVALGVSHPKLDRIRELIDYAGIGWTKLTGAGGGGCAITILKQEAVVPDAPAPNGMAHPPPKGRKRSGSAVLEDLRTTLKKEGFEIFSTSLAGDGVGILYPAVLHNESEEEGGDEIDQEKFLNAKGNEGIEKLVGVDYSYGKQTVRLGWRFWRPWVED